MVKLGAIILGSVLSTMVCAAELVQSNNGYTSQLSEESCINNFCAVNSPISNEPDCEQICRKCVEEAQQEYNQQSDQCKCLGLGSNQGSLPESCKEVLD